MTTTPKTQGMTLEGGNIGRLVDHERVDQVTICGAWLKDEEAHPGEGNPCGYLVVVGGFHPNSRRREDEFWGATIEEAVGKALAALTTPAERGEGK